MARTRRRTTRPAAAPVAPPAPERVDPALFASLVEATRARDAAKQRLEAAAQALTEASGAVLHTQRQVNRHHALAPHDRVNADGTITRAPAADPKAEG